MNKSKVELSLKTCFRKIDSLNGLAKFVGLISYLHRCGKSQQLRLLEKAREQAELLVTFDAPDFSSRILVILGVLQGNLERHEEALNSFDKSLELQSDNLNSWANRGAVLLNLECYEEALNSFNKALEIKPNYSDAWANRGSTLGKLDHYEEALASFDKALEFQPDNNPETWLIRGSALFKLERYEEAVSSYDKSL